MSRDPDPRPGSVQVGFLQAEPGSGVSPSEVDRFRAAGTRILVLPEYFWVGRDDRSHADAAGRFDDAGRELARLSRDGWIVVGGTAVEPADGGWHNTCLVYHDGREIARYRKINLMPGELRNGALPGGDFVLVEADGVRIAPVVCADVLDAATFAHIATLGADLITAPMASPFLPDDTVEDKERRDRDIFVRGAEQAGAPIVKVCGVGSVFGHPLQGRSLVATARGVLHRTPWDAEQERRVWTGEVPLG